MPPTDTRDLLIRGHQTRIMSDYKFTIESLLCETGLSSSPPTYLGTTSNAGRIRGSAAAKHGHGRF